MAIRAKAQRIIVVAISLFVSLAVGCGGGGGSTLPPASGPTTGFWATDFTTAQYYRINTTKVAEGVHCYIYLEQGQSVSQATINAIVHEFDTKIYPTDTATFGSEPNPGIDNDPKIYILLLDIRDGFDPITNPSFVAGYFDPLNEYPVSQNPNSNQKEMLYMDIYPTVPGSLTFFTIMAHEFQHMIHWEQKTALLGVVDDTWLDEGMAEIAPVYCGYGPSYDRVFTFESTPSDSLTIWNDTVEDYGVVYMWAQYFKDRFSGSNPDIFWNMLHNSQTGINSVNAALASFSLTFTSTFRDWAIANYSGNAINWGGHPEWSYTSIDMRPGNHGGVVLPGLSMSQNASQTSALDSWSVGYYDYTTSAPTGSVTWTLAGGSSDKASFVDSGAPQIYPDLASGATYTFKGTGYLIVSNPTGAASPGNDTVSHLAVTQDYSSTVQSVKSGSNQQTSVKTPRMMLDEASMNPSLQQLVQQTGEPQHICVHSFFSEREKALRAKGARPPF